MSDDDASSGFEDYIPTTSHIDNNILFFISLGLVVFSLLGLPLFAAISKLCCRNVGNGSEEGHLDKAERSCCPAAADDLDPRVCGEEDDLAFFTCGGDDLAYYACGCGPHPPLVDKSDISCGKRCRAALGFLFGNCAAPRHGKRSHSALATRRRLAVSRGVAREDNILIQTGERQEEDGEDFYYLGGPTDSVELVMVPNCGRVQDDAEASAQQHVPWDSTPSTPLCSFDFLRRSLLCTTICKFDKEMKRLLRLVVPFTISSIAEEAAELFVLITISHTCGEEAMIAYIMVSLILGISGSFTGGCVQSVSSLASMAYGGCNYDLAGQYLQAACIIYVILEVSTVLAWGFNIDKVILLIGFEESVADLSNTYVWLLAAAHIVGSVSGALLEFLEVIGKEVHANVFHVINCVFQAGLVALFFIGNEAVNKAILPLVGVEVEANLNVLGIIMLASEVLFFLLNIVISLSMGWLEKFEDGIFRQFSLKDVSVLKEFIKVALPLMFGGLLSYAEWEILIVFAAILGPAEAVTWGILGCLWDFFESTTSAIGEASEVRCARHLGKGHPEMARLSAYKSILFALIMSLLVTGIFVGTCHLFPSWLTDDETIQTMLAEVFPLIAVGNVMMNMGMVCYALVGAQGRYRLATTIAVSCSLFITIPLGALMTLRWRIDLEGLTFAVIMGYTAESAILSVLLLMSDWKGLSNKIQAKMAAEELSSTDSDDTVEEGNSEIGYTPAEIAAEIHHEKKQTLIQHMDRADCRTKSLIQTNSTDSEASRASGAPLKSEVSMAQSGVARETQASKMSQRSEVSERDGYSRVTKAPNSGDPRATNVSENSQMSVASNSSKQGRVSLMTQVLEMDQMDETPIEIHVSKVANPDTHHPMTKATHASMMSQMNTTSNSNAVSIVPKAPMLSETLERNGATMATQASKMSHASEVSKMSGASRVTQTSKMSQVSNLLKGSADPRATNVSENSQMSMTSNSSKQGRVSLVTQVLEMNQMNEMPIEIHVSEVASPGTHHSMTKATQASMMSQMSKKSNRSGVSRVPKASKISQLGEASERSGASRATQEPKTSQVSEVPKKREAPRATKASRMSQIRKTAKRSGAWKAWRASRASQTSKIGHASKTSKRSGATRMNQASKMSQAIKVFKRSGASGV